MFDFKDFRKANNFTQKDAAAYFGCEQSFISLIETKRSKIPSEFISKILADNSLNKSTLPAELLKENTLIKEESHQDVVLIPDDVWGVIKNQSESLKMKDDQLSDVLGVLKNQVESLKMKDIQTAELLELLREQLKKSPHAAGLYSAAGLTVVEEDE